MNERAELTPRCTVCKPSLFGVNQIEHYFNVISATKEFFQ